MVAVSLKKKKKKKKKKKNIIFFFFKQKTAYEMCDSDWSSDVCSSDLIETKSNAEAVARHVFAGRDGVYDLAIGYHDEIGRASCRERVYTKV